VDVEQPEHLAAGEPAPESLERIEQPGAVAAPDDRAHRGAGDDVRAHADLVQRAQYADMRPAARRAAAERKTDARRGRRLLLRPFHVSPEIAAKHRVCRKYAARKGGLPVHLGRERASRQQQDSAKDLKETLPYAFSRRGIFASKESTT